VNKENKEKEEQMKKRSYKKETGTDLFPARGIPLS